MNRAEFVEFIGKEFDKILETQKAKGRDYSGDEDVFFNFKRSAKRGGLRPLQVWSVLAGKHWDAIMSYIESDGESQSEPIEGRLHDLEVYCFLMQSFLHDEKFSATIELSEGITMLGARPSFIHFDLQDGSQCISFNPYFKDTNSRNPTDVTCPACKSRMTMTVDSKTGIVTHWLAGEGYPLHRVDAGETISTHVADITCERCLRIIERANEFRR